MPAKPNTTSRPRGRPRKTAGEVDGPLSNAQRQAKFRANRKQKDEEAEVEQALVDF